MEFIYSMFIPFLFISPTSPKTRSQGTLKVPSLLSSMAMKSSCNHNGYLGPGYPPILVDTSLLPMKYWLLNRDPYRFLFIIIPIIYPKQPGALFSLRTYGFSPTKGACGLLEISDCIIRQLSSNDVQCSLVKRNGGFFWCFKQTKWWILAFKMIGPPK